MSARKQQAGVDMRTAVVSLSKSRGSCVCKKKSSSQRARQFGWYQLIKSGYDLVRLKWCVPKELLCPATW